MKNTVLLLVVVLAVAGHAAELRSVSEAEWRTVGAGRESDAIVGDWVLQSDRLLAVVGATIAEPLRQGNTMTPDARGALLELAWPDEPEDQLTALLPGGGLGTGCTYATASVVQASGPEVILRVTHPATAAEPYVVETDYALADGQAFIEVTTTIRNTGAQPLVRSLADKLRLEGMFLQSPDAPAPSAWWYEAHYRRAYGVVSEGGDLAREKQDGGREAGFWLRYGDREATIPAGGEVTWARSIYPARDIFELQAAQAAERGETLRRAELTVAEPGGRGVGSALVTARAGGKQVGLGTTNAQGKLEFALPAGKYALRIEPPAGAAAEAELDLTADRRQTIEVAAASRVVGTITDGAGQPVPAKVAFTGRAPTKDPLLGQWYATFAVKNLVYTPNGRFDQVVPPGSYDVVVSHGPEFDAWFGQLDIQPGKATPLEVKLPRVIDTTGWIAADLHGHTSHSGDNNVELTARVINLAAEGIEFAPSTDHVRLVDWQPGIDQLGLNTFLKTCLGEEISGPGAIMHHNAFPLPSNFGAQANGGIPSGGDLTAQTKRITQWQGGGPWLIQLNHPNVKAWFFDEQHPEAWAAIHAVEAMGNPLGATQLGKNRCYDWIQILSKGLRLTGIANTDSHAAAHGAGYQRNWIKSATDTPAEIDPLAMVEAVKRGQVVMSTGPFMTVTASAGGTTVDPGAELTAPGGKVVLRVKVQCPNWMDIDRVQVLVNGEQPADLNVTRAAQPARFGDGVVKFEGEIPITLTADAHLIVVAAGSGSIAKVIDRGPKVPYAVSNPVWVKVGG